VETRKSTRLQSLNFGVGALAVLVISVGVAAIIYSMDMITFDFFNIPAWIFGPFGVYTILYSFAAGKEFTYYLVWGTIMFSVAIVSAFFGVINPIVVFGILIIVIAVIGLATYWRSR